MQIVKQDKYVKYFFFVFKTSKFMTFWKICLFVQFQKHFIFQAKLT